METGDYIDLHQRAMQMVSRYPMRREPFDPIRNRRGQHHLGIMGPRGVGKTVMLRQLAAADDHAFYLSADTMDRDTETAWNLILALHEQYGYQQIYLDEIHFLADPAGLLKRLYDFTPLRLVFSSSVALAMRASAHDVARRVDLIHLPLFSFREYLRFRHNVSLPTLNLGDLLTGTWTVEHLRQAHHFQAYLTGGILPFAMEEPEPLSLLARIRDKIIARDIPSVARLVTDELDILPKMLQFIGRSAVDGISYSALSSNLGITKYKARQYVELLDQAYVLQQLFPAGTGVLKEPKILMMPPYRLLYGDIEERIGGLREDFAAMALTATFGGVHYLKSRSGGKTPDFLVEYEGQPVAVEVGGKGKGREQFKGVEVDQKLLLADRPTPDRNRVPLFLLGFLA